jgi:hypothetical protein
MPGMANPNHPATTMQDHLLSELRTCLAFLVGQLPPLLGIENPGDEEIQPGSSLDDALKVSALAGEILRRGPDLGTGDIAERAAEDALCTIAHCDDDEQLDQASDHANYNDNLGGVIAQRIVLVAHLRAIGRL